MTQKQRYGNRDSKVSAVFLGLALSNPLISASTVVNGAACSMILDFLTQGANLQLSNLALFLCRDRSTPQEMGQGEASIRGKEGLTCFGVASYREG